MKEGAYMELKFRAWEKSLKEMIPIHSIDFQTKMINTRSAWRWLHEVELMQYTGLHDKNGKEIYEGDIVEFNIFSDLPRRCRDVVAYSNGCFKVEKRTELLCTRLAPHFDLEIIGNIYDNPELLKEAK
jgi:uncharacterized phage protein (TIGR01671 family)